HARMFVRSRPRRRSPTMHASNTPRGSAGEIGTRPSEPSEMFAHAVNTSTATVNAATTSIAGVNGSRVHRSHRQTMRVRGEASRAEIRPSGSLGCGMPPFPPVVSSCRGDDAETPGPPQPRRIPGDAVDHSERHLNHLL